MAKRIPVFGITATVVALIIGVAVAVRLLVFPGGSTSPPSTVASVQRACDAMTVQHYDASVVMTDTENRITQTLTVAGNDSRLVSHTYPLTGAALIAKIDILWKAGIQYWRESPEAIPKLGGRGKS